MKKIISVLLIVTLTIGLCTNGFAEMSVSENLDFKGLNDPALLPYIEDTLYSELVDSLGSEDYFVENVSAIYISQEYLDEVAYNSQANVFFGYTLAELDQQFQGEKYIFTLGDNGETNVEPFVEFVDDDYNKIIRNVAIGAGIILICVTVSIVTVNVAPAVSIIFAVAAETGTELAITGAKFGALSSGILSFIQTRNLNESFKQALVGASEGFKWGAIGGAISGGAGEAIRLRGLAKSVELTMNDVARIQQLTNYSPSTIKTIKNMEEFEIYKEAGLSEVNVGDKRLLLPDVDWNYVDKKTGLTNLELVKKGNNPVDITNTPYEWHHIGQKQDSALALLTHEQHTTFDSVLHDKSIVSEVRPNGDNSTWLKEKKDVLKALSSVLGGK